MIAKKKYLKDQILINDKTLMFCPICTSEYSANRGDYWNVPDDYVFKCCNVPMQLVTKQTVYKIVKHIVKRN